MKISRILATGAAVVAAGTLAHTAGMFETLPVIGNSAFCASNFIPGPPGTAPICAGSQVPAGPPQMTGNEFIPADTNLPSGASPQTAMIPSGMLASWGNNVLVGPDFGQALWQRGATPVSAATPSSATMSADGWYVIEVPATSGGALETVTVSKQTGSTDVFTGTLASARIQRVASQTLTAPIHFGQLVPNDSSGRFLGNNAVFSCYLLAGANFSPNGNNVNMVIAYHSAADATSESATGQGTNTATFATSVPGTQNITSYTEAVNTPQSITTTWTRYSVAAAIPVNVPGTTTPVTGVGVKLEFTPVGTAGTNDWVEVANCQLEARAGTSTGPSLFNRRTLAEEYNLELARFWRINEPSTGTPIYGMGQIVSTGNANLMLNFPTFMRLTPTMSPVTIGGFRFMNGGSQATPSSLTAGANTNQTANIVLNFGTGGLTAGQATMLVGSGAGTGVLGFSAEP